jgi:hypothetical protein
LRALAALNAQKCWFFYRTVVMPIGCSRFPRTRYDIATHSRLGGQHGEEAKDEDKISGEEGREEDQAPQEEVTARRSQSSTSSDVDDCVKRAGVIRRAASAS